MSEFVDSFSGDESLAEGEIHVTSDIFETRTHYVIELELPGVDKKDVKISAQDEILTVKGEKKLPEDAGRFVRRERRFGTFIRSATNCR